MITIKNIPLNDEKVFSFYRAGNLIGTFQTESPLCRAWSKRLNCRSLSDISAILAAVRPGVLESHSDDGRTMIEVYRARINGEEALDYFHPLMEDSLKDTYSIMLYQEQMLNITEKVTNFDPIERHRLLKAVSKKNQEEISAVQSLFVKSAVEKGVVTEQEATRIYEGFKASGRYLFCRAHSYGYAILSYITCWLRANYTLEFVAGWCNASPKSDLPILIRDAKGLGINVLSPSLTDIHKEFKIIDNKNIRAGFSIIMGMGDSKIEAVKLAISNLENYVGKSIGELSWLEILINGSIISKLFDEIADVNSEQLKQNHNLSKSIIENLIKAGALDFTKTPRNLMLNDLRNYKMLSPGEKKWCAQHIKQYTNLIDLIKSASKLSKDGGAARNPNRLQTINSIIKLLENPPICIKDRVSDIVIYEKELLGVALSANSLDKYYTCDNDTTIKEYLDGKTQKSYCLKVEITRINPIVCKRGKSEGREMAFISAMDETGELSEIIAFPDQFFQMRQNDLDYEGAQLLMWGERDPKQGTFIIQKLKALV